MTRATMTAALAPLFALALCVRPAALQAQGTDGQGTPRPRISWTSDRREYVVGDVITVLVNEATLATAVKGQNGSDEQSRKNDIGIEPPKLGTSSLPTIDATVGTNKRASSRQSGDAKRDVRFQGEISVRVTKVENGNLQVKGQKLVDLDNNKQTLNFSGWIRPQDVSSTNVVASDRVADAQLVYSLSGALGKTRGGIVGRLISVFWP
ncbi:MAG TPA: flagellar basal body L-ring protein FlgH [Gemmatimonadaceae bacterium]